MLAQLGRTATIGVLVILAGCSGSDQARPASTHELVPSTTAASATYEEWTPEGSCASVGYDEIVSTIRDLQASLAAHDADRVAELMSYPVSWTGGSASTEEELLASFDAIFSAVYLDRLLALDPGDPVDGVWCNADGFTVARGELWGQVEATGPRIFTINGPGEEPPPSEGVG